MSAQGAPVRSRQKMPLSTRRSSTRGTPRGLFRNSGWITVRYRKSPGQARPGLFKEQNKLNIKALDLWHHLKGSRLSPPVRPRHEPNLPVFLEDRTRSCAAQKRVVKPGPTARQMASSEIVFGTSAASKRCGMCCGQFASHGKMVKRITFDVHDRLTLPSDSSMGRAPASSPRH
jgi:hypothetical protein